MSNEYGEKLDTMHKIIEEALPKGEERHVFYSAYKASKKTNLPVNNLNKIAIQGKAIIVQEYEEFWDRFASTSEDFSGNETVHNAGSQFQSSVLENPTWLDLAVVANKMIQVTHDYHHQFLENVTLLADEKIDGVQVYEFWMGS